MDKNSLRKIIADKLGISSSKKEFAFDVFLKKISQSLEANEAISIPGIGYFQLKNEPLVKEERKVSRGDKKLTKRTIFYSPAGSIDENGSSLFLSFDIDVPQKDFSEFDENIFSLGIQKPIVPIFEDDESLTDLQKSLESRIDELIHSSEKLNDFDLFDNYMNQIVDGSENMDSKNDEIQLEDSNNFSDLNIEEIDSFKYELPEPEISDWDTVSPALDEPDHEIQEEAEEAGEEEKNPFDELDEIKFDDETVKPDSDDDQIEMNDPSDNTDELSDQTEAQVEEVNPAIIETGKSEIKKAPLPSIEELIENDDDMLESDLPVPDNEIDNRNTELIDEDEESIEWDWGDELKAEFQEEAEEDSKPINEINESSIDVQDSFNSLAEDLENEIEDEEIHDEELNDEESYNEEPIAEKDLRDFDEDYSDDNGGDLSIPDEDSFDDEIPKDDKDINEAKKVKKRPSYRNYDWKGQGYGKGFWILLASFVFVTFFGLYYLLFWGGEKRHTAEIKNEQPADSMVVNLSAEDQEIAKVDTTEVIKTEPIKVADVETPPTEEKTLYRKIPNESRVNSRIYSDGNRYMVQVSSFKTSGRAESDAMRLQSLGFDAFIVEANLPQLGGKWYRVRIGYFKTSDEAQEFIKKNNL